MSIEKITRKETLEIGEEWAGRSLTWIEKEAAAAAGYIAIPLAACKVTMELYGYQDFHPDTRAAKKHVRAIIATKGYGRSAFVCNEAVNIASHILDLRADSWYAAT